MVHAIKKSGGGGHPRRSRGEPIDHDAVMRYEASQQELVRSIIDSLHQKTDDVEDHHTVFRGIAFRTIDEFDRGEVCYQGTGDTVVMVLDLFKNQIMAPIDAFTDDKDERQYLLAVVLEEVMKTVYNDAMLKYLAKH